MTARIDFSGLTLQQIITLPTAAFLLKQPASKFETAGTLDMLAAGDINPDEFKGAIDWLFSTFLKGFTQPPARKQTE